MNNNKITLLLANYSTYRCESKNQFKPHAQMALQIPPIALCFSRDFED